MTGSVTSQAGERVALRDEIAGRTLGHLRRELAVVPHDLDDILAPAARVIPPAGRGGWPIGSRVECR